MTIEPSKERLTARELRSAWSLLARDERVEGFLLLASEEAEDLFLGLSRLERADLLLGLPPGRRRLWLRLLAPDDAADVLQAVPPQERAALAAMLDDVTHREVNALLAYEEDVAGGLMSPRFARVRPDMSVEEAIRYLRRQADRSLETIYYVYVLDPAQKLLGVVSFRELITARGTDSIADIMKRDLVTVAENTDQEVVSRLIARRDLLAVPVVDEDGRMQGIVTVDDIVDVVQEEATEDAQKFGGVEVLETPYLQTGLASLIRKRTLWLTVLFAGELLTANAMAHFEAEIARAVVLALFVPLIISSGGNAGSQAATLVIRAMALGEVRLRDWWRVMRREFLAGTILGLVLASLGFLRVVVGSELFGDYGPHVGWIALTVGLSLTGVVLWGTLTGSMLPFALRRLGADPASASAPFVATLVDVLGLVIYFSLAEMLLRGRLL